MYTINMISKCFLDEIQFNNTYSNVYSTHSQQNNNSTSNIEILT